MTAIRVPASGAPGLELSRHLRDAGRTLAYLLLGIPYGLVSLLLIGGGLILSALLSLLWIGLPLLALVGALAWRLAEEERRQANRLLDAHLPPLPRRPPAREGWRRGLEETGRGPFWRALAMLLLRAPVSLLALVLAGAPAALCAALLTLGVQGLMGDASLVVGPWELNPLLGIGLCMLAIPAAIVSVAAFDGAGRALAALARALLRSRVPEAGPVRELLAERLGDRSLNIAYWLPDREIFVDERGRRVNLPEGDSGRAWTAVEHEGRRVAAIVHDAELDASPELVQAAASAAALAIDNERLKADLRARLEELRVSRLRIVEAADEARRRLERDLHDGAQQQLVALALELRMLRGRVKEDPEAAATVDAIGTRLSEALAELRELARGIHPAVLSDRGLGPAIDVLVSRVPIPVDVEVDIEDRLQQPVEAAAYFVVSEGLTNVVKYAQASQVGVIVCRRDAEVEVVVEDDGVGGATLGAGTGLRGLADRLAALEGRLAVHSPPGRGTRLEAHIPCNPEALVSRREDRR